MNTIGGWSEIFVWSDKNLVWKKIWSEKHFGRGKKNLIFLINFLAISDDLRHFSFLSKNFFAPPPIRGGVGAKKFRFFKTIFSPFQMILNIIIFFQNFFLAPPPHLVL